MRVRAAHFISLILASFLALLLNACGGGGGSSSTPTATTSQPPSARVGVRSPGANTGTYANRKAVFEASSEYRPAYTFADGRASGTDTHLARINAAAAYADGWTGRGQTIAVVDSGFRDTHRELRGKTAGKRTLSPGYIPTNSDKNHGTWVASVAAGGRSGSTGSTDMHGVAFDARLHYTEIRLGRSDGIYRRFRLENYNSLDDRGNARFYSDIMEGGRSAGARIINLSFGRSGAIATYNRAEVRSRFATLASIFAQTHTYRGGFRTTLSRSNADKSIFVWAAGNGGGSTDLSTGAAPNHATPEIVSGLGLYFPELQTHTLAVVALDQDGTIASYSNRCGGAAAFCIAAPGTYIVAANYTGDDAYRTVNPVSGTSFAAPIVSGALAVVAQRFPGLGNHELVARIKASANKTGIYANSAIYGQGLLDLGAAIAPIGAVNVAGTPLARSFVTPGGSFGDALESAFADRLVAGFDSLNAPFHYRLNGFVQPPNRSTLQPLQTLHTDLHAQRGDDAAAHASQPNHFSGAGGFALRGAQSAAGGLHRINADASSHMHLSHGGVHFAFAERNRLVFSTFAAGNRNDVPQVAGLSFAWRPQTARGFAFGGGYLRETNEMLQSEGSGAFGGLSAQTVFLATGGIWKINQWHLHGGAEVGVVSAEGDRWFDDLSTLLTSSFSLSAARRLLTHDEVQFGLSSPLRVEHGKANITLPIGRTRDGAIRHIEINPSLTPSGRQIDLTATWQRRLPVGHFTLSARASHNPNHTATAPTDIATLASYRLDF